jgi:hypothetical protein
MEEVSFDSTAEEQSYSGIGTGDYYNDPNPYSLEKQRIQLFGARLLQPFSIVENPINQSAATLVQTQQTPKGDQQSDSQRDEIRRVAVEASCSEGEQMWKVAGYGDNEVGGGHLGCAASVSGVLLRAGYAGIRTASVDGLASQLKERGWQRHEITKGVKPGDVVILARHPGRTHGHTGIIGEDGKFYQNDGHCWKATDLTADLRRRLWGSYVLRAPGAEN